MRRFLPIILNQASVVLLGILGVVLVSHIVPREVYGAYGLFLTLTQIGVLLTHSGLINSASRFWQREHSNVNFYARFLFRAAWKRSASLAAALLGVSVVLAAAQKDSIWLLLFPVLLLGNLAMTWFNLAGVVLNAGERHWALLMVNVTSSAARALFPAGMALLLGATLFNLGSGFALHGLALAGVLLVAFRKTTFAGREDAALETAWLTELRDYGRPFILMGAGGWLLLNVDRWVVAWAFGWEQAGLFNLAANISGIVPNMAVAGLLQWVFPGIFRQADISRSVEDWQRLARKCDYCTLLFLGVTVGGLLALAAVGPYLVGWLISEQYAPSMAILLPAGLAAAATQINQFQYLLLQGQHDSASMAKLMIFLAALRTAGSMLAAMISWPLFLGWLMISTVLVGWLGRSWIQRTVFSRPIPGTQSQSTRTSISGRG
jgi:O-antigen/teichoic acid export membrane protein